MPLSAREVVFGCERAFLADKFAEEPPGDLIQHMGIMDITRDEVKEDDLPLLIDHQMQLKAIKPT